MLNEGSLALDSDTCLDVLIILVVVIFLLCILIIGMLTYYYIKLSKQTREVIYVPNYITIPVRDLPSSSSSFGIPSDQSIQALNSPPLSALLNTSRDIAKVNREGRNKKESDESSSGPGFGQQKTDTDGSDKQLFLKTIVKSSGTVDMQQATYDNSQATSPESTRTSVGSKENTGNTNESKASHVQRAGSKTNEVTQTPPSPFTLQEPFATQTNKSQKITDDTSWYHYEASIVSKLGDPKGETTETTTKSSSHESQQYDIQNLAIEKSTLASQFKPMDDNRTPLIPEVQTKLITKQVVVPQQQQKQQPPIVQKTQQPPIGQKKQQTPIGQKKSSVKTSSKTNLSKQ